MASKIRGRNAVIPRRTATTMLAHLLLVTQTSSLQWFRIAASPSPPATAKAYPLYPLPATYLPGSTIFLRNSEPRNVEMATKEEYFVATQVSADRSSVAAVGALLRIDGVENATRDASDQVLATPRAQPRALRVRCSVVGRCRVTGIENPDAWRDPSRSEYLVARVEDVEDDDPEASEAAAASAAGALRFLAASLARAGAEVGMDAAEAGKALAEAADFAERRDAWAALELWQRYAATRRAAVAAYHRAERDELIVDAKLREGGVLSIPVNEATLGDDARARLADLDRRAAEYVEEMDLADDAFFQACLESTAADDRLERLAADALREGGRVAQRAALARAFNAS
jgi:hypothetical protein